MAMQYFHPGTAVPPHHWQRSSPPPSFPVAALLPGQRKGRGTRSRSPVQRSDTRLAPDPTVSDRYRSGPVVSARTGSENTYPARSKAPSGFHHATPQWNGRSIADAPAHRSGLHSSERDDALPPSPKPCSSALPSPMSLSVPWTRWGASWHPPRSLRQDPQNFFRETDRRSPSGSTFPHFPAHVLQDTETAHCVRCPPAGSAPFFPPPVSLRDTPQRPALPCSPMQYLSPH